MRSVNFALVWVIILLGVFQVSRDIYVKICFYFFFPKIFESPKFSVCYWLKLNSYRRILLDIMSNIDVSHIGLRLGFRVF